MLSKSLRLLARCTCWLVTLGATTATGFAGETGGIKFNRDVRPILSDKCFACHGPDKHARQADLRLDQRDVAVSGGAITPGQPEASGLIERIDSDDPETVMPPPKSHKTLTPDEKQLLRRWIAEGAEYEPHWSFVPVPNDVPVPAPVDASSWIRNPLDAFVLDRLRRAGLEPAAEAPRENWLRRVSFDLTGLPPSLAELDDFLADDSPQAYETAVARLLNSPAFGERIANDWLDVARYADTFGYQSDRDTHVWPWRNWVIRAFNDNLPYDQFILWQTAGDLLPDATPDQRLATAFNRLHRQTNEGGSVEEEFRIAYVTDRVVTNGTAFLGLTLECARCHEHKYDPLAQQDFYRLAAFFADIDEHGLYSHFTETAPTPALLLYEGDQATRHAQLIEQIRAQERRVDEIRTDARERFAARAGDEPVVAVAPLAKWDFEGLTASGDYHAVPGRTGQAIEFGGDDAFACKGAGNFGRTTPFSLALWVKPARHEPRVVVAHQSVAAEDSAYRGHSLMLENGRVAVSLVHFWPGNAIRVETQTQIPLHEWTHLAMTYDGQSQASGVRIYVNGQKADVAVVRDRLTRDIRHRTEWGDSNAGSVEISLGARFRDVGFREGAIDDFVVFDRRLSPLEVRQLAGLETATSDETDRFEHFLMRHDEAYRVATDELLALRRAEDDFVTQVRQIMVLQERFEPRPTYVLRRGAYDAPEERVDPDTPASIFPFPAELPRNRLGLARWMIDDRNPLVSRVATNRFWQLFFGRGLVVTAEDFGAQGQAPTHPELLDWLARRFMNSGWNVKELCQLIVLSATYRQSSVPRAAEQYETDPDNRLLARGPRYRLAAEQIRDNALAACGLLSRQLGGPSVRPYQPAGLWEESGTGKTYVPSTGADLYRRSLYTFWRRTSPPPTMLSFDATSREVCTARRERTATPLQALVLLNDPQFVEAARVLAEKLIRDEPERIEVRLNAAFRLLTSRFARPAEIELLTRLHREQRERFAQTPDDARALLSVGESPRDEQLDPADHAATAVVVNMLMNYDECVTKR